MRALEFVVHGTPAPQGSKRHLGKGVMVESSKRVRPWREAVKHAALDAIENCTSQGEPFVKLDGPVTVLVHFGFDRPRSHYRTGRNSHLLREHAPAHPTSRGCGDVEKLVRATFDAMTDAGVWGDDSQVVRVHAAKVYVENHDVLTGPGAAIYVMPQAIAQLLDVA